MATLRHASDFFRVEVDAATRRVIVKRLARPFASAVEAEEACRPVLDVLTELDRTRWSLLMDARIVPGKNDPDYESWYAPFRKRIVHGFSRVAVLVRSVSGKLQASRLASQDHTTLSVFTDEAEAERWLSSR